MRLRNALGVRLAVDKTQRIGRGHFSVQFFAVRVIKQLLQPFVRANAKVIVAVHAHLEIVFQLALIEMRTAFVATDKDIFGANDALRVANRFDLAFLFTKPGHMKSESRRQTSDISIMSGEFD